MRKITLLLASWPAKSSWVILQPEAFAEPSLRPLITKRSWTPPSLLNRASRIGPLRVMNEGTVFLAPDAVAIATWGLTDGLLPPSAGWIWQPPQLSRLNRGPSPLARASVSAKIAELASKKIRLLALMPDSGLPAAAPPPRTPGSLWASAA